MAAAIQKKPLWLGFIAMLWAACSTTQTPVGYCTAPRSIAVLITVQDSLSGAARADSATGTLRNSITGIADSLRRESALILEGGDQVGTYQVVIDRAGYRTWSRPRVVVSQRGPCGNTIPVELLARLQPTP